MVPKEEVESAAARGEPPCLSWKQLETEACKSHCSSRRSSRVKGTRDCTSAESPGSSLRQRPNLERPRSQVSSVWSWLVEGGNGEPHFSGPVHGGLSRADFHKEQRNHCRLKSWSLIKIPAHLPTQGCTPAYGRQIWLSCLLTLCQKGPLLIRGHGASMDFLSETVPSHAAWKEPAVT